MRIILKLFGICSIIIYFMQILIGCSSTQIKKEIKFMSFNINTSPPGANIFVSHYGHNKQQYSSPATINIVSGYGFIELSKEGCWDEDRLIVIGMKEKLEKTGTRTGAFLTGGIVGVILNPPLEESIIESDWNVYDHTRVIIDSFDRKTINNKNYYSEIKNNTIQINFLIISPILIPILKDIKEKSKRSFEEANKIIKNVYDDGKINKEEFLRAQMKVKELYYGKFGTPYNEKVAR
jgi:hypothetical protein